ncbi:hypothetical protein LshimejAT787_1900680 [Lyophyllum shimeji]|uniref:EF-hand domain-containing protein n=1 Tax=Lyophyllum shimeji TaxID=47721 RepID=A0A9P3PZR8_LYOSH|nr:hypothetical protein LshimejAT787_1900680 [Lyophyllum shimeji]
MPAWPTKNKSSTQNARDIPGTPRANDYTVPTRQDGSAFARIEAAAHSADPYKFVNEFFAANQDTIGPKSRNIADFDTNFRDIEDSLNGFADSARTLVKGLQALGHLHPFIGVAVGAFALVVSLDLTRRDNDRKVLAVKVQMQDLMRAFFELRHIPSSEERGPDGITVASRLESLMELIAKDIKACGSACDAYLKKGFLAKTVKASVYEARLADFATLFVEHRKTLELSLSIHTSLGVDSANQKLDNQNGRLQTIEEKLDMMILFRKLDTPREKDLQKFIEEHGGAKACIANDELLEELVAKSGESLSRFPGREFGRRSNDLPDIKKRLLKEMQEDIDEAFNRNMVLFERKLDIQNKQLSNIVQEEADHIISTLLSGAHDRITDPDLQKIWKDMGWKGSVKARHFVLALHDYYTDKLSSPDTPTTSHISGLPSPQTPGTGRGSMVIIPRKRQDDRWALAYINAAYVQPILEAVDDDGTGFVSVKEVNTFVAERPENWSLPHWIAYWAVVQTAVDEYLFHSSFWRIELLLRSTRSVGSKVLSDPDLAKTTESYETTEEERLDANLRDVNYELDTPDTVSLITGAGRIERYVFPLIYLLLRRHLLVMRLACKHVVDTEEFVSLNDSLVSILLAIDHRIQNLEAIFKQTHLDVQARLGNFAFGIFQLSYGDIRRVPADNSFASWADSEGDLSLVANVALSQEEAKSHAAGIPLDILKYGIQDGYSVTDYYEFENLGPARDGSSIEGTWTGHYQRQFSEESISCVLRVSMRLLDGLKIVGKGEDFTEAFEFVGDITSVTSSSLHFKFVVLDKRDGTSRTCTGYLDESCAVITVQWKTVRRADTENRDDEPFTLRRVPPALLRYRYTPHQFAEDPVRSRWSFACSAALHQAQEALWSRRFFEARFAERKRYVELTTRALIVQMVLTPQVPLTLVEKGELEYLRQDLNPSEARFYQALAEFEIQKLPWHPAWGCDWCERQITKCRILCVVCISEDLSDNIDLCASCVDRAPTKRGFTHEPSHAVVKVEQTLHDYHIVRIVGAARTTFERVTALFRSLESVHLRPDEDRNPTSHRDEGKTSLSCACCGNHVLPPCWVCIVCTKDTFICADCDSKRLPSQTPAHTLTHAVVRIHDRSAGGRSATADDRLLALEQQLLAMEHRVAEGFAVMESRAEERYAALEARVEERLVALETRLEDRLSTMEVVLRQIAAQTAALPAVYGQVIRDYARSISICKY